MSGADDAALVRACLAGDTRAFDELVCEHGKAIYNLAYRVLGDAEEARDVAQTTFLKAWENLERFDERHKFFSWIYRIAMNEALNVAGGSRRRAPLAGDPPAPGRSAEELAASSETSRQVQAALLGLEPDHRLLIVLRHFSHLGYHEIARIVGVPEKTVKSRLFTARQLLRRELCHKGVR
ncbi:MAG: sigma-70 family RNA polymerase sigma factor [Acidobacteria bacterium]|nr:sigma-70 family RNA polymerase sigma factor [Acidobacteriota bacterium]